jgi:hypothetical protein
LPLVGKETQNTSLKKMTPNRRGGMVGVFFFFFFFLFKCRPLLIMQNDVMLGGHFFSHTFAQCVRGEL